MNKRYVSWGEVDNILCDLVAGIKECVYPFPDRVVGIANGGTIPAGIIARELGVPLELVYYSSKNGNADGKNHPNKLREFTQYENILLVDDLTDSGKTMIEVLRKMPWQTVSVTMFAKETAEYFPKFTGEIIPKERCNEWIVFPWETT